ncbi:MAG: hypothetical protein ABI959_04335, partial [Candidatus Dormiibacterota bacterium]
MYLGTPGDPNNRYAMMEVEALARGETVYNDPPDGRLVRSIKVVSLSLVTVAMVAGVVWLAGGNLATIVAAVIATVIAFAVVAAWRVRS